MVHELISGKWHQVTKGNSHDVWGIMNVCWFKFRGCFQDDILENLESAFTIQFEAGNGKWLLFSEFQRMSAGSDCRVSRDRCYSQIPSVT